RAPTRPVQLLDLPTSPGRRSFPFDPPVLEKAVSSSRHHCVPALSCPGLVQPGRGCEKPKLKIFAYLFFLPAPHFAANVLQLTGHSLGAVQSPPDLAKHKPTQPDCLVPGSNLGKYCISPLLAHIPL